MDDVLGEFTSKDLANSTNSSSHYEEEIGQDILQPEAVVVPLTFAIIFATGMIGNILLLCHIAYSRKIHTPQNMYVANLAVGDLLMLTVAMPFVSTIYTFNSWPYGEVICKVSEFALTLSTAVIIFTLVGLSIERYFIVAVYKPSKRQKLAMFGLLGIWLVSIILSLPDMVSAGLLEDGGYSFCIPYPHSWGTEYPATHTLMKFLLLFFFPLLVIAPFHILVATTLLCKDHNDYRAEFAHVPLRGPEINYTRDNMNIAEEEIFRRSSQRRKRIAVTVLSLVLTFIVCWMPRHIYLLWFNFDPGNYNTFWHCFKIASFCMMFANSGINPMVFYILDLKFRNFVLSCICRKQNNMNEDVSDFPPTAGRQTMAMTEITQINNAVRIDLV